MSAFSKDEKRRYMLKTHIRNHLFEYIADVVTQLLFVILLLYICHAENFVCGIIFSIIFSMIKISRELFSYKREYVDIEIK